MKSFTFRLASLASLAFFGLTLSAFAGSQLSLLKKTAEKIMPSKGNTSLEITECDYSSVLKQFKALPETSEEWASYARQLGFDDSGFSVTQVNAASRKFVLDYLEKFIPYLYFKMGDVAWVPADKSKKNEKVLWNEKAAALGNKDAIFRKLFGLSTGNYGYKRDLASARGWIMAAVKREESWAYIEWLSSPFHMGEIDYQFDLTKTDAETILNKGLAQNKAWAKAVKIAFMDRMQSLSSSEKALEVENRRKWLEQNHLLDAVDFERVHRDILADPYLDWLDLYEKCQKRGDDWALRSSTIEMCLKKSKCNNNLEKGHAAIIQGVDLKQAWAWDLFFDGIRHGDYGFERDPEYEEFIRQVIKDELQLAYETFCQR